MGIVSRKVRDHYNQKLAVPSIMPTRMTWSEVVEAVQTICDSHNDAERKNWKAKQDARRAGNRFQRWLADDDPPKPDLYTEVHDDAVLVSWSDPPATIQERGRPGFFSEWWIASVGMADAEVPDEPDANVAYIKLLVWVTDDDGKMKNKDRYEALVNAAVAVVSDTSLDVGDLDLSDLVSRRIATEIEHAAKRIVNDGKGFVVTRVPAEVVTSMLAAQPGAYAEDGAVLLPHEGYDVASDDYDGPIIGIIPNPANDGETRITIALDNIDPDNIDPATVDVVATFLDALLQMDTKVSFSWGSD